MQLTDKRVLVTGADGFIGSHLVERLVQQGTSVRALVHYNSFNCWGWLEELPSPARGRGRGRRRPRPALRHELLQGIDVVFHLAALIPIPYSYVAPDSYVETNVKGTLNLCQAARATGVAAVRPHLDQRGLRHGAVRADRREASADAAVALQRDQDRRRCRSR